MDNQPTIGDIQKEVAERKEKRFDPEFLTNFEKFEGLQSYLANKEMLALQNGESFSYTDHLQKAYSDITADQIAKVLEYIKSPNTFPKTAQKTTSVAISEPKSKELVKNNVGNIEVPDVLIKAGLAECFTKPKQAFINAGGTELQFAREINFAMQAMMKNTYLITCAKNNPEHLIESIKNVALTGLSLNPELKLAYLVPYKGKISFQSSYMGKREILMQCGTVRWIEVNLVYESEVKNRDFIVKKGTETFIEHTPDYFNNDKGALYGGYWIAVLPNGDKVFDVVSISDVEAIRMRSPAVASGASSPWDTDYNEMVKKTILNKGWKYIPKTGISNDRLRVLEVEMSFDNQQFEDWKTEEKERSKNSPDRFDSDSEFIPAVEIVEN